MEDDFCEITHFREITLVLSQIDDLIKERTDSTEPVEKILNLYQEQSQLLDVHLEALVAPIIASLERRENIHLYRLLYIFTKVRGYKTILRIFSHEANQLEATISKLLLPDTWERTLVLIFWLSELAQIPFDLVTITDKIDLLLETTKSYLDKPVHSSAAAVLIARILVRKDMCDQLASFCDLAIELMTTSEDQHLIQGYLYTLATIFKLAPREYLHVPSSYLFDKLDLILEKLLLLNPIIRKCLMKLLARLALANLKPKIASWRYDRGHRHLTENLMPVIERSNKDESISAEEDEYVPEGVEGIVGTLLLGLQDKDTIVRWSSAKGVGKITERLPLDFAQEVIDSCIELFEQDNAEMDISGVNNYTWHGACLVTAELSRRGLLLPGNLKRVVPWIIKALKFDIRKGYHSIGSHVRDAACYVCWAFARAYSPEIMAPFSTTFQEALVICSVYDREVNIRRAGSAAFQENGIYSHGIDIVTCADYFAVGNRNRSFLEVSVEIAAKDEYRQALVDHLIAITSVHWDKNVRELASKTLAKLTPLCAPYMAQHIPMCLSADLTIRHGSLLSLAEILIQVCKIPSLEKSITAQLLDIITHFPPQYLKSSGQELTRQSCCKYISSLASSGLLTELQACWDLISSCLAHRDESVQIAAAEALFEVARSAPSFFDGLLSGWCGYLASDDVYLCRGYALAFGKLPTSALKPQLEQVFLSLINLACNHDLKPDSESKRNAVNSITQIVTRFQELDDPALRLCGEWMDKINQAFIDCLNDYTIDSRGDVGSWVREAAIIGLGELMRIRFERNDCSHFIERSVQGILQQSVEKIDRVRGIAGATLTRILWAQECSLQCDIIRHLSSIIIRNSDINWLNPSEVYPLVVPALRFDECRYFLLKGLIVSVGGLTESLVRHASSSLLEFLESMSESSPVDLLAFVSSLLLVFSNHVKDDRISIPLLDVLDLLMDANIFMRLVDSPNLFKPLLSRLLELISKELYKSRDPKKILCGIKVYCGLVTLTNVDLEAMLAIHTTCLKKSVSYLSHTFPKIRRATAEQLYLVISTAGLDAQFVNLAAVETLLISTNWDLPLAELKPTSANIRALLGI